MRIFLIRHGETDVNASKKFQGITDEPLNEAGIRQSRLLAKKLSKEKIDAVYSSALARACQTAEEIAKLHGLKVIKRQELNEVDYGEWEGKSPQEIEKIWPGKFMEREKDLRSKYKFRPPGGETYGEMEQRVRPFFEELVKNHQGQTVVIVSHGAVKRSLLRMLLGIDFHELPGERFHNTGLTLVEKTEKGMEMRYYNSREHLSNDK